MENKAINRFSATNQKDLRMINHSNRGELTPYLTILGPEIFDIRFFMNRLPHGTDYLVVGFFYFLRKFADIQV